MDSEQRTGGGEKQTRDMKKGLDRSANGAGKYDRGPGILLSAERAVGYQL